jgi:phosphoglycerate dehydrogenase-like enzyme
MTTQRPILVVEDDQFIRIIGVVLDPSTSEERRQAFAYFFAHDEPDFEGWCESVRKAAPGLYPAEVRLAGSEEELPSLLTGADVLVTESFAVDAGLLAAAGRLAVVQKYGTLTDSIDTVACAQRGVKVLTLRRRANVACAEQTMALMLTLAKRLNEIAGLISVEQLQEAGFSPTTYDRRHTAMSGWARISGLKVLYESTLGIVGFGEIGREVAMRAKPFGMKMLYYQRHQLSPAEEERYGVRYAPIETLLQESDWISVNLPITPATRDFFDRTRLAMMKPGACLINTARAEIVQREAVVEALASGHLGGFALDPLYEEPGRSDDELLQFSNVVLTPHTAAQPRFNALNDLRDLIVGLATALTPSGESRRP